MRKEIPNRTKTQLRIDKTLCAKVHAIADMETRNFNSQLEYFIKKGVEEYERINGSVPVPDSGGNHQ